MKRVVLAEGEMTGHAHVATGNVAFDDGTLSAPDGATVTHEEHRKISLPAGDWDVSRVLEYDHFAEEARKVAD